MLFDAARRALQKRLARIFIDLGPADATVLVSGMGRSGTSWVGNLINHDHSYRILFEPFVPTLVPEASEFQYIQYMNPANADPVLRSAARTILAGKLRNRHVDQGHGGFVFRRRLVKGIRCQLMVGWLRTIFPSMPIVLVTRNPYAVTSSWLKLGWGAEAGGPSTDFDVIVSQEPLLRDFPALPGILDVLDRNDAVERIAFQWCVFHRVALEHLLPHHRLVIAYENLLHEPQRELERLFSYLEVEADAERLKRVLHTPSGTNFLNRDVVTDRHRLVSGWRAELTDEQVRKVTRVLELFGMEDLYDDQGLPR